MLHSISKRLKLMRSPLVALMCITAVCLSAFIGINMMTKTVKIVDGGRVKAIYTLESDPNKILKNAGVTLQKEDAITFTGFYRGSGEITLQRAFSVYIDAYGKAHTIKMIGGTVGDALKAAGIEVADEDIVNFDSMETLAPGMSIAVSDIDYSTITQQIEVTPGAGKGYTGGENGTMLVTYSQKLINGKVVETSLVEEQFIKKPVAPKKVAETKNTSSVKKPVAKAVSSSSTQKCVSTLKPASPIELDSKGRPVTYKKLITGKATAYTHTGNHTATGKDTQPGYIAVNPKQIPYGTKLYIKTSDNSYIYGYAVAADTGGFVKNGTITADLLFDTYAECIRFGVRNIEIYVLE